MSNDQHGKTNSTKLTYYYFLCHTANRNRLRRIVLSLCLVDILRIDHYLLLYKILVGAFVSALMEK